MKKILCLALSLLMLCAPALAMPAADRAGNPLSISSPPERVISFAPAATQVIASLGLMDRLIGVDAQSPLYVDGLDGLAQFDIMAPDCEAMAALEPDLVLVSGLSFADSNDPFDVLRELGVTIAVIPSSDSIDGIARDVQFIADVMGASEAGEAIVSEMFARIGEIEAVGRTITEKKRVMFEISALPYIYSFGSGTFLSEMIELIGAENVFADRESWIAVTEEAAVAANPDVILTSVNYLPDPVGEILGRTGWEHVRAVASGDVYYIDNAASSLPNQFIVKALIEMARVIYPEAYASLDEDVA